MKIVYCLDENYLEYAKKSIASVRKFNPTADILVVCKKELPVDEKQFIVDLDYNFKRRGEKDRITDTAYLKCFLTRLPDEKILYIDADVICQKPLDDLWNQNVEYIGLCESHKFGKTQAEDLGVEKYGLTGMMLMNLANLRKIGFSDLCMKAHETANPKLWCHDETCINVAMKDKLTFLPIKYHYCHNREYEEPINEKSAYLLHYVGKHKEEMLYDKYKEIDVIREKIKGKRVAIVGNAKSIFDKMNGMEIDKHDTVIRFNKGMIQKFGSQGGNTDIVFCSCELNDKDKKNYGDCIYINRSKNTKCGDYTISQYDRKELKEALYGVQPSTGFMAIDICLEFGAKEIDLYGFDFGETPTYYNPLGCETKHDYNYEEIIIKSYEKAGLLKIF